MANVEDERSQEGEEDLEKLRAKELRVRLLSLGLKVTGRKSELRARLQAALEGNDVSSEEESSDESEGEDDKQGTRAVYQDRGEYHQKVCVGSMLSLKDVEDSLEKFSGDDLLSVNQWVKDFEEMAEMWGWSDAHMVVYARRLLAGSARAFVRLERCTKSWATLKKALKNEFGNVMSAQQHEDDLEQLVELKKQLEKKLADAYEEVEEQRQVVGKWKRRVQKLNGEMHDLRLLLEEQTARNNLLEKKQRKFDSETQNLMNDPRHEKAQRKRLAREKEIAIAEKFTIEQNLSDARLEIELKEERLRTLGQELEELTFGGKTEEEVAQLKKAKHELEKRVKDQEEELDDLAGQVQLLEQAKLRLEMSIEQQRKEIRKEMQQRDEELEDVRGNALEKVKALESQVENEREERTILLREKHELERRLVAIEEQDRAERAAEADTMHRLKRDLKRTKALLRDAQTMLERSKGDSTGKAALRQLKSKLEDAECARAVAIKAKQALEQELNETQASLQEALRQRSEAEDRANVVSRERTELLSQLEENKEELAEVLKKYRAAVQQLSEERRRVARHVVIGKVDHEMVSSSDSCGQQEDLANITRRKNLAKQQQQDVVDDICEFTEKDSVAGVRVVASFRTDSKRANARRTKRQGKLHARNPSNNIDTKIRYTEDVDDEDDDGIVEDTMNVRTFEKGEIIVSEDGKLLTSSTYEPSLRKCHDAATTIKAPDKSETGKQTTERKIEEERKRCSSIEDEQAAVFQEERDQLRADAKRRIEEIQARDKWTYNKRRKKATSEGRCYCRMAECSIVSERAGG